MLYLSQLTLNPRSRQVQAELRDPYEMHRTLAKAFGEGAEGQSAARCLFRVEEESGGISLRLLVQSRVLPSWQNLAVPTDYLRDIPQVKSFNPALTAGQLLSFRLRANPTVRREGKRLGLYRAAERLAWLSRKATENGFSLLTATEISERSPECQAKSNKAVFSAARFEGVLRVLDPENFSAALAGGIGAGKGFGFGLLSISRLK